jgi:type IV pilus assembly protein PilA
MKKKSGFTLLEILLVVGIIAILASIVVVALNPTRQFASVRNAQRRANISEINNALQQYYIDNSAYPPTIPTTLTEICNTGATSTGHSVNCTGRTDLSYLVPTYLVAIPVDPQTTGTSTNYKVMKNSSNKIVLEAAQAEQSMVITVGPYVSCGSALTDARDGKQYATILIGTQCWMKQNLNVGTMILGANTQGTSTVLIDKYCYSNQEIKCDSDGGLYQWNQAMGSSTTAGIQGICPTGWHIPTDAEFKVLIEGQATAGCESTTGYLCAPAASHLATSTLNGDNSSGFTANMSGYRNTSGSFVGYNLNIYIWSSTDSNTSAWRRVMASTLDTVSRNPSDKMYGASVRCLRD